MPEGRWTMPNGWPYRSVDIGPSGFTPRVGTNAAPIAWRRIASIERPGDGQAVVLLADGSHVYLPDQSDEDARWLAVIAEGAASCGGDEPTAREYAELLAEFGASNGPIDQLRRAARHSIPSLYEYLALVLGMVGGLWVTDGHVAAACMGWAAAAALLARAAFNTRRRARTAAVLTAFELEGDGIWFTLSNGRKRRVPAREIRGVRTEGGNVAVVLAVGDDLTIPGGTALAETLAELVRRIVALRGAPFTGMDAMPPPATALSRLKGETTSSAERGISLHSSEEDC